MNCISCKMTRNLHFRLLQEAEAQQELRRADDGGGTTTMPQSFVAAERRLWVPRQTITVEFLNGSDAAHSMIMQSVLAMRTSINFQWSARNPTTLNPGMIRIFCEEDGPSWSYVGTDHLLAPADERTMNLGWIERLAREGDQAGSDIVVQHEFMHTFGCLHAMQNPDCQLMISDAGRVYYKSKGMTDAEIVHVFERRADPSKIISGPYDAASLMNYGVKAEHAVDGVGIEWPSQLSAGDWQFLEERLGPLHLDPLPTPPPPRHTHFIQLPIVLT